MNRRSSPVLRFALALAALLSFGALAGPASAATLRITLVPGGFTGPAPTTDAVWLRDWSCDQFGSSNICVEAHASANVISATWPSSVVGDWDNWSGTFMIKRHLFSGGGEYRFELRATDGTGSFDNRFLMNGLDGNGYYVTSMTINKNTTPWPNLSVYPTYVKQAKYTVNASFDVPPAVSVPPDLVDFTDLGTVVTRTCTPQPGYLCSGWTLQLGGGGTSSGTGTTAAFTLSDTSTLTWDYRKAFNATVSVNPAAVDAHPVPGAGAHLLPMGAQSFSADTTVPVPAGGTTTRYQLREWSATGSLFGTGTTNPINVNLITDTQIQWNYDRQHLVGVAFASGVDPSVAEAADPTPPAGDSWLSEGTSLNPFVNKVVRDSSENRWECNAWTKTMGGVPTAGSGPVIPRFVLTAPTSIVWGCTRVQQVEVRADALPAQLQDSRFDPPVTTGYLPHGTAAARDFTAPIEVYDLTRENRYEFSGVILRRGGVVVQPDSLQRDEPGNRVTATLVVSADVTVEWVYTRKVRLEVNAIGLTELALAAPRECEGYTGATECVSDASDAGGTHPLVAASGVNYYVPDTPMVATVLNQVADGGDRTCANGVVVGSVLSAGGIEGTRRYAAFHLTKPTTVTWLFSATEIVDVGAAIAPPEDWDGLAPAVELIVPALSAADPAGKYFFGGNPRRLHFLRPFLSVKVAWRKADGASHPASYYLVRWPSSLQPHLAGVPVNLQPPGAAAVFAGLDYTDGGAAVDATGVFRASLPGHAVLRFVEGPTDNMVLYPVVFTVVETHWWTDAREESEATVGVPVVDDRHRDPEGRNGLVLFEKAYYDGAGESRAYDRETREGPIVPVNATFPTQPDRRLVVAWWSEDGKGIGWPSRAVEYFVSWPSDPPVLTVGTASRIPPEWLQPQVYVQPDPTLPGFNPNEEHALLDGGALYALRSDLNARSGASDPYVLLKYRREGEWSHRVFRVEQPDRFAAAAIAGSRLVPPLPPSLSPHGDSDAVSGRAAYHRDRKGGHWAKAAVAAAEYPVGDAPSAATAEDVSGDGVPDLLVANSGDGTVSLLRGNGDGTFQAAAGYAVGGRPAWVRIDLFDADAIPDLAVIDADTGAATVLLGDGGGAFHGGYPATAPTQRVAEGLDFNRDGKRDLLLTAIPPVAGSFSVRKGRGDGTFEAPVGYGPPATDRGVVTATDLDGDGKEDLLLTKPGSHVVEYHRGNGDGTFAAPVVFDVAGDGVTYEEADLTGDGVTDYIEIVAGGGLRLLSRCPYDHDGAIHYRPQWFLTTRSPVKFVRRDVNGDGWDDLLVAEQNGGGVALVIQVPVDAPWDLPTFNDPVMIESAGRFQLVAFDFVDGDAFKDLLLLEPATGEVFLRLNRGTPPPGAKVDAFSPLIPLGGLDSSPLVGLRDVDGDGRPDLVTEEGSPGRVSVHLGKGDGAFRDPSEYGTSGLGAAVAETDLNGDGLVDRVAASPEHDLVHVYLGSVGNPAPAQISMAWSYPMQRDFYYPDYDRNFLPDKVAGDPVSFVGEVVYTVNWPPDASVGRLPVGEVLTAARDGLPGVRDWASGQVIFDESVFGGGGPLAKLYAPLRGNFVTLAALPADVRSLPVDGEFTFPDLPYALRARLAFDAAGRRLIFRGVEVPVASGGAWLLPDIMTAAERDQLDALSAAAAWKSAVTALYARTRDPQGVPITLLGDGSGKVRNPFSGVLVDADAFRDSWGIALGLERGADGLGHDQPRPVSLRGEPMALTAGMARGEGYLTLAEGDDPALAAEPVQLHVLKVAGAPVFRGELRVMRPENIFDERLTLRHTGDFGGEPERFAFEWYYREASAGVPPLPPDGPAGAPWLNFGSGAGMVDVTIAGASPLTLADNWFVARYYYRDAWPEIAVPSDPYNADAFDPKDANNWSGWAGAPGGASPQLVEGWSKRVFDSLNLLESRVRDFRSSAAGTQVSMISQLGERYRGDVAFGGDPAYLEGLGLIQAYETILRRAMALSVDSGINHDGANTALLNAASRLADFYLLLGNEAYADSLDPTIGLGSGSSEYGSLAPSIFAFQNQLSSLLDEELCLLRGRDSSFTSTRTPPFHNRLIWNFTRGDGEVAYAQTYNIGDSDGNGVIDAADARRQYPQGHGDAWGHYLTAITTWLKLLRHPNFVWQTRPESVLVGETPVLVDYQDERKFAAAAAARARAGAGVLDLTYRKSYVDDPAGQWQGYKDTEPGRAWGVDEWARRVGQGALFEWALANSLLPAVDADPTHTGIRKVDRTTVMELQEIAGQYGRVQGEMNKVDRGLNPLGLAKGAVVFDIDPALVDQGKTHFEQVYDRALKALRNAADSFDYASSFTRSLRQNDESLEDFRRAVGERESDYLNRLVEVFGYPYPEDIGATYPAGYDGPDWVHYMYVDRSALTGEPVPAVQRYTVNFAYDPTAFDEGLGIGRESMPVEYVLSAGDAYLVKPPEWTGRRRAPGEAQRALSGVMLADAALARAIEEYDQMLAGIEEAKGDLASKHAVLGYALTVTDELNGEQKDLDALIGAARDAKAGWKTALEVGKIVTSGAIAIGGQLDNPRKLAFIAGATAVGATAVGFMEYNTQRAENEFASYERTKEQNAREAGYKMAVAGASQAVKDLVAALEARYNGLILKQLEIDTRSEELRQAVGQYQAVVAEGQRLLAERSRFRAQTAADVQEYRYDDLSFRVFRNDALQKYRAQFDLAARYVYLAAAAYDYETNLLGTASGSGGGFMADIVRQRGLGQLLGGNPVAGQPGLADPLARMAQNFEVYRSQLGFNNPQTETNRFSLREELFRQLPDAAGEEQWRVALRGAAGGGGPALVQNLWDVPEFKRFCRPFAPESSGPQPGLVIPFSTKIAFGKNFFGLPLAAGDSAYDPSNFATKVRKVGVWFEGYDTGRLSLTPRVYLVPVGADVLRSPTGDGFALRAWNVLDQKLPVPFALGASDLTDAGLIPVNDSLSDILGDARRFSSFRAYPDPGDAAALWQTQMTADSRLIGRSVWNTRWLLIIPGGTFLADPEEGLDAFVDSVQDIKLFFQTYAYSGN